MAVNHHARVAGWINAYLARYRAELPPQLKIKVEVTQNEDYLARMHEAKLEEMFGELIGEIRGFLAEIRETRSVQAEKTFVFPPNIAGDPRQFALVIVTLEYWEYYYDDLAFVELEGSRKKGSQPPPAKKSEGQGAKAPPARRGPARPLK